MEVKCPRCNSDLLVTKHYVLSLGCFNQALFFVLPVVTVIYGYYLGLSLGELLVFGLLSFVPACFRLKQSFFCDYCEADFVPDEPHPDYDRMQRFRK